MFQSILSNWYQFNNLSIAFDIFGVHVWFNRMTEPDMRQKYQHVYCIVSIVGVCLFLLLLRQIYTGTRSLSPCVGTFPVCPQQRTGACKCYVIVVVFRLRVQKLTPAELRLFATQCGSTVTRIISTLCTIC